MAEQFYSFRGRLNEVPKGAVVVSRDEALQLQINFLDSWKSRSDVFPLKYSHLITSGFVAVSSAMLTTQYRRFFRLKTYGRYVIQLPTMYIPSLFAAFLHKGLVTNSILLQDECPVCVQVRSIAIQVGFAVVMPSLLAPLACLAYAENLRTYPLPPLSFKKESLKAFSAIFYQAAKKGSRRTGYIALTNFVLALFLCFWEQNNFSNIHSSIAERYDNIKESLEGFEKRTRPDTRIIV